MRLATTLMVAVAVCSGVRGSPQPLLGDLLKATKSTVDSAGDATKSSLQGATGAASAAAKMSQNAVDGAVKTANKIARTITDEEYYSIKHILDLYWGCVKVCVPNLFNSKAKEECEEKKKATCKELNDYSMMDYFSYKINQMYAKMTGAAVLDAASSATNNAIKMG